jgi:hypothetical protein
MELDELPLESEGAAGSTSCLSQIAVSEGSGCQHVEGTERKRSSTHTNSANPSLSRMRAKTNIRRSIFSSLTTPRGHSMAQPSPETATATATTIPKLR